METSLKDYMVGVCIGQGSFGTIYHGIHKETKRNVAIKLYDKTSLQKHPEWLSAVLTEQRVLRILADCPFVATLLAAFHDDQFVYLALEFFQKGTLSHFLEQRSKMDEQAWLSHAVDVALGIVAAIEAIHNYHVIHADLKPDNILMTVDSRKIVLIDFGSALLTSTVSEGPVGRNASLRGTAAYAAPELIRGNGTPTEAVDLWSFGCLLHTLWAGKSPFHADSEALILDKVVAYASGDFSSASFGVKVPSTVLDLIRRLLDPNPEIRACCTFDSVKSVLDSTDEIKRKSLIDRPTSIVLPDPGWAREMSRSTMKDGILGWGVFL
jgi:serine/threonine protein kinase